MLRKLLKFSFVTFTIFVFILSTGFPLLKVGQANVVPLESEWTFNNTSTGRSGTIQSWTVPSTGFYRITASGAQGGGVCGGSGAEISGTFELEEGQVLDILVGQTGGDMGSTTHGGGGGGTFVTKGGIFNSGSGSESDIFVIAGGGGGCTDTNFADVAHASAGENGKNAGRFDNTGGVEGSGGGGTSYASGGGGLLSDGVASSTLRSGRAFINGGEGGSDTSDGGFGGGGSGYRGLVWNGMTGHGGGGGYSGGEGDHSTVFYGYEPAYAGGGGSFNSGMDQNNVGGINTGHGLVTIQTTTISPLLTTEAADSVSTTEANFNGTITSAGGDTVTRRGFVYTTKDVYEEFDNTSTGRSGTVQSWTVPTNGTYRITAYGAQGGGSQGGLGAKISGDFDLLAGQVLDVVVGQEGTYASVSNRFSTSGGGGTFVTKGGVFNSGSGNESDIFVIAGGGGGSEIANVRGKHGYFGTLGRGGVSYERWTAGGLNGGGGTARFISQGGAGFLGGGGSEDGAPPTAYINGALGGLPDGSTHTQTSSYIPGGFGGGGGTGVNNSNWWYASGGGGYSGGGSASESSSTATLAGGGGGSYNAGTNQDNESGVRAGHGRVTIALVPTVSDGLVEETGTFGVSSYNLNVSDLSPGTDYVVRAFAENSEGLRYGNLIEFSTLPVVTPTLTTEAATDITGDEARLHGTITSTGGDTATRRGFVYREENLVEPFSQTFTNTSTGRSGTTQSWTVPYTGVYRITAYGAQGGVGTRNGIGGLGAKIEGEFELEQGEELDILVGQEGGGGSSNEIGGGGGTFVTYKNASNEGDILIIAGGGGGYGVGTGTTYQDRAHASITQSGKDGYGGNSWGSGGSSGQGGGAANTRGSGGGGFLTDGQSGSSNGGGQAFLNGALGGIGSSVDGGFGGGGATDQATGWGAASGGGGYSGGGGAYSSSDDNEAVGGGGGSYNAGTNQTNEAGIRTGHGQVEVELLSSLPTLADSVIDETGTFDTGSYSLSVFGLNVGTDYVVRAFAENSAGVEYGDVVSFSTLDLYSPIVSTNDASNPGETTYRTGGNITDTGNDTVTRRGVQYGTTSGVYTLDSYEEGSFTTGSYNRDLTGLSRGTRYFFRAYAINSLGTGQGTEKQLLTLPAKPSSLSATGGVVSGRISLSWTKGEGAETTYIRGKIGSYPTSGSDGVLVYTGTGTSFNHDGLDGGDTWYYRAWSYVADGGLEQYSSDYGQSNATAVTVPVVSVEAASNVTHVSVRLRGNITNDGGEASRARFRYKKTTDTEWATTSWQSGLTTNTDYHKDITGLDPVTDYEFQTQADNDTGTSDWSSTVNFQTMSIPCQAHNVWDWAWSSNTGWLSFSCGNSMEIGVDRPDYGVDIDEETGAFSGHAWSEHLGWIDFSPAGPYPQAPNYSVTVDVSGELEGCGEAGWVCGWARACSVFDSGCSGSLLSNDIRGDWDGWIFMGPYDPTTPGVWLEEAGETLSFRGYAWGDENIGWLNFDCDDCAKTSFSFGEDIVSLSLNENIDYCAHHASRQVATGLSVALDWEYEPGDEISQSVYQIQISENADFPSNDRFEKTANSFRTRYVLNLADDPSWKNELDFGKTYYWRVRVSDGSFWSNWNTDQFTIVRTHPSPFATFSYSQERVSANESVVFEPERWSDELGAMRTSQVYDGSTPSYSWTFTGGSPSISTSSSVEVTFVGKGKWDATLQVTDGAGYSCSRSRPLEIDVPIPEWRINSPQGSARFFLFGFANGALARIAGRL